VIASYSYDRFMTVSTNVQHLSKPKITVIGAGIGGLTAAALLAAEGFSVSVYEQSSVPGGCASTFRRRGFTFDVGATQVAGLEPGGIHARIFERLRIPLPASTPCDPICAVYLPGETTPISIWRDPDRWAQERRTQFPGSDSFWKAIAAIFARNWQFQSRDPIIPPQHPQDLWALLGAVRWGTVTTLPWLFTTVGDLLRRQGLADQLRLKQFLDLQLKLYSQVNADQTALLYGATALGLGQSPHGVFHLHGSMQVLSDRLVDALERDGGQLHCRHQVEQLQTRGNRVVGLHLHDLKTGHRWEEPVEYAIANLTVQNLSRVLGTAAPAALKRRVQNLPPASGAFVLYLGVRQAAIPVDCPLHLQFLYDAQGPMGENNSLFVSVSQSGDGRAPEGCATIVASTFTDPQRWRDCFDYPALKRHYCQEIMARLGTHFDLASEHVIYCDAATPRTFERFTGRANGVVGGIGQRPRYFGPFGFGNRTAFKNLWLVGDSTHPGEGTAGVSYSAWTAVRQLLNSVQG
jgi:C-3',4' desaturase CrtD